MLEKRIARSLIARNKTLAIAESCTGGLVCDRLTNIPGSSAFLVGGIIAYSNTIKKKFLKIPPALLSRHGAVSAPVAQSLAHNIRKLFKTDIGIGITGIAGPSGGSVHKPVGRVYIGVSLSGKNIVEEFNFKGPRKSIKNQAATKALEMLAELL